MPSWQLNILQLLIHSAPQPWWDGEENWKEVETMGQDKSGLVKNKKKDKENKEKGDYKEREGDKT